MTIIIDNEEEAIQEMENVLQELETTEVSEAIKRACRVNISDLLREE